MNRLAIVALSLVTAISSVPPPALAFPTIPAVKSQTADVQQVQFSYERGEDKKREERRARNRCPWPDCFRGERRWYRDRDDWSPRYSYRYRDRWDDGYYRHRRFRHRDRDNDLGAALGGFAAGAIIGGLLAQPRYAPPPRYYVGGSAHTRWCYARYRSYRPYDNTFQPYYGPRRQCISPYM